MAKKRLKASRPDVKPGQAESEAESPASAISKNTEQQIKAIIEKGRKKGFLTYEEMNDELPEEAVSPARLDSLLATLDEIGINLLDEADVVKQAEEEFETLEGAAGAGKEKLLKEDELLEKQLSSAEATRRIDDPIRVYLTQMGEIPLLTREAEIALARKIELTRMGFRRKMLQCDYCARNAVDILQQVYQGTLSFDRTMKISTAENLVRAVIKKRMPQNIATVNKLLKIDRNLFRKSLQARSAADIKDILKRMHRNKRKVATLLEELSLRTSRIQPMKNKLHGICQKMRQLERTIACGVTPDYALEDIDAMKQELAGLQELVVETPKQLEKRLRTIDRIFGQYEQTKRLLSSEIGRAHV